MIFVVMCLGAELIGGLLTAPAIRSGWYDTLEKPFFNPPAWVFGPVWTALFVMMAVAARLVWKQDGTASVRFPLYMFYFQLVLNVLWSALFFASKRPGWALLEIVVLWVTILAVTVMFAKISRAAGLLFLPYLGWVTFALFLNGAIWWLNRSGIVPVPGGQI